MKRLEPIIVGIGFVGFLYLVNKSLGYVLNTINKNDETPELILEPITPSQNQEENQQEQKDVQAELFEPEQTIYESIDESEIQSEIPSDKFFDVYTDNESQDSPKKDIVSDLMEKKKYLLELQNQLTSIKQVLDNIQNELN